MFSGNTTIVVQVKLRVSHCTINIYAIFRLEGVSPRYTESISQHTKGQLSRLLRA